MNASPAPPRILVAGVGNIFLGDDAFGVEVAQRLLQRPLPQNVRVVDFGIRGIDLVYALTQNCDIAVFLDIVPRGDGPPGTLYLLQPEPPSAPEPCQLDLHTLDPAKVLQAAKSLDGAPDQVYIIGCEPAPCTLADDDDPIEMSPPVKAALTSAVQMVESLLQKLQNNQAIEAHHPSQKEPQQCPT